MKQLKELTESQLKYIREKHDAEIIEINREAARAKNRLDLKVQKQVVEATSINQKKADLEQVKELIIGMEANNMPQKLIDAEKIRAITVQEAYDAEVFGVNLITDEEAYFLQVEIELMRQKKEFLEQRITEIDSLSA